MVVRLFVPTYRRAIGGDVISVAVRDTLLFFGTSDQGLKVYSIANPASPVPLGTLVGIQKVKTDDVDTFMTELERVADYLATARPTAVNLGWALNAVSGPGTVTFDSDNAEDTTATFSVYGVSLKVPLRRTGKIPPLARIAGEMGISERKARMVEGLIGNIRALDTVASVEAMQRIVRAFERRAAELYGTGQG